MSLVGFKAQNHAQQVLVHGARAHVDDRAVTPEDFAPWQERFAFTLDAAASTENAKLPRYLTPVEDGLAASWRGERVYCNPPFSGIEPWVEKAWAEYPLCALIVMLLPANRTEQGWWQRCIEPFRHSIDVPRIEFLPGRLRFLAAQQEVIRPNERPPFGCCLAIWGGP